MGFRVLDSRSRDFGLGVIRDLGFRRFRRFGGFEIVSFWFRGLRFGGLGFRVLADAAERDECVGRGLNPKP